MNDELQHSSLALPTGSTDPGVGAGYRYVVAGEMPEGLDEDGLVKVT
jgi:hypothetical protein